MACRFLLVLLAVAAMTAQAAAQNADSMLPPPSPLPNTKAPGATTAPPIQDTITPVAATSELTLPAQPSGLGVVDRCWFNASYMLGWTTPTHLPPLVTTSPAGTPQASAGVLGVAGTSVITGDQSVADNLQSGFKVGMGSWCDQYNTLGFNTGFFMLLQRDETLTSTSNGSTILARPFKDATTGSQVSLLVAFPSGSGPAGVTSSGSVAVRNESGPFYGFHFDLQENIYRDAGFSINSLFGYRFLRFDDGLQVQQTMHPSGGGFTAGTQIDSQDSFTASNTFNGLEIGFDAQWQIQRWSLGLLAKVAAGQMNTAVGINGSTQISVPGAAPINDAGGLLALSTNSGTHRHYDWTASPEFGVNLGWNMTDNIRLTLGYSLLFYWDVAQAADQIDPTINPNLLNPKVVASPTPGSAMQPTFFLHQSNLLLQSINLGMELRF